MQDPPTAYNLSSLELWTPQLQAEIDAKRKRHSPPQRAVKQRSALTRYFRRTAERMLLLPLRRTRYICTSLFC